MAKNKTFTREEVFPSWWPNAISEQVGIIVENFELRKASPNSIEVPAGTSDDLAVVGIDGRWRFRTSNAVRAHPGGAAGVYPVFAVCAETNITGTPLPYTDATNYAWDLRIEPPGGSPALSAGVIDFFRKVGEIVWDGSQITAVRQLVGQVSTRPAEPTSRRADETPLRVKGIAGQTAEIIRVEDSTGAPHLAMPATGGLQIRVPTTGEAFGGRGVGETQARVRLVSGPLSALELGDGALAPDIRLARAGGGQAALTAPGGLFLSGGLAAAGGLGLWGKAAPVQDITWGSFTRSDGTAAVTRRTLAQTYSSDELVDVLYTLVTALRNVGILGAVVAALVRGKVEADKDLSSSVGAFLTGDILPFAGDVAPAGWRLCLAGDTVPRSSPLGLKLAGRYGTGDGSTTYDLPPLAGRMPLGKRLAVPLGTGGDAALTHSPAVTGLSVAAHAHGVGGMYYPNHGHGHTFYLPWHGHGFHTYPSRIAGGNTNMGYFPGGGGTGGSQPGVSGGIAGQGNQALGGVTGTTAPAMTGTLAAAEPPWAAIHWIIKL